MRRHMKLTFAAGILLALGATGIASAADMAVKARPVVAPVTPWTGCYIGGNAGGGWTQLDTTRISNDAVGPAVANYGREKDSGFIGGGQVGCDFQTGSLVLGVQGTFDFGDIKGQHAIPDIPGLTDTNNLKSFTTVTGRFGWLFTPTFLTYGKFGAAWVRDRNQVFTPGGALVESSSFTVPGLTAGIGGEWMFAPNWSVYAEYNYMWFLDDTATHLNPSPGFVGEVINVRQKAQTALVGVNYKFHWDGPIVAKY
jgi:outer membrane immunogenic protein